MRICKWLYYIGMNLAFLIIILAQIIWLFDPVRVDSNVYWIDTIEVIVYLCAIVPLLWMISAIIGIKLLYQDYQRRRSTSIRLWMMLKSIIVICTSLIIILMIVDLNRMLWISIGFVLAWLCVILDLVFIGRKMANRWNRQTFVGLILTLSLTAILLYPTPYMVTYPGLTLNMGKYAVVEGEQSDGEITGVLIFERPAFPVDWLYDLWFPHYEFTKRTKKDLPLHEQLANSKNLQYSANLIATVVAFEKAGYSNVISPEGEIRLPKEVQFNTHFLHAGGPSHGAMLTLSLLNQIIPEGVTFGNRVAGTGTIHLNGEIGNIGGIKQKAYIVERAGADVFFVPAEQFHEAQKGADQLQIVPVRHLDDMLQWLKEHPKIIGP